MGRAAPERFVCGPCNVALPPLQFLPNLVRIVKGLIQSNHSSEHDVSSVCDPFLQVGVAHTCCQTL